MGADRLLTERDVAGLLAVSVKLVQLWRYEGKGPPYVKFGRCVRYRQDHLAVFVSMHEVHAHEIVPQQTAPPQGAAGPQVAR